jgi:hypothetical protein
MEEIRERDCQDRRAASLFIINRTAKLENAGEREGMMKMPALLKLGECRTSH